MWTHPSAVVTQFTISCAVELLRIEVDDKWRHNDVIVEKVIIIDQNSRSQTATAMQGRSDGGRPMWVYIPPKSVQVNFLWGKNDVRTAIEHEY